MSLKEKIKHALHHLYKKSYELSRFTLKIAYATLVVYLVIQIIA